MRHSNVSLIVTIIGVCILTVVAPQSMEAQTFSVIHSFTGGQDGAVPKAGLTIDRTARLYGTTFSGGANGYGAVYQLAQKTSSWVLTPLYSFQGGSDGSYPYARVVLGPDGSVYGTTAFGGSGNLGTVFHLKPQTRSCSTGFCAWSEDVLVAFNGSNGNQPVGDLTFDPAGNLYGTTSYAGYGDGGTVYELSSGSGGWTLSVLHTFGSNEGYLPAGGVIFDYAGNLYGTTEYGPGNGCGGGGCGIVFQLVQSSGGWTENILYEFQNGSYGENPVGGVIMDSSGNLYGTTPFGQSQGGLNPVVFELTPSGGGWTFSMLYAFNSNAGPYSSLVMDSTGNLYGTTNGGGAYGYGTVFKLTPGGGGWVYSTLHDFTGNGDGGYPFSNVVLDGSGYLYGTASVGGAGNCGGVGCGVVWKISP